MNLDPFLGTQSFLHRRDPRVKVVLAAFFTTAVAVTRNPVALGTALGVALVLALWAHLPRAAVTHRLVVVNGFVALLWVVLPFTQPGVPVGALGPLTVTHEGLILSAVITLRTNAIILATMALLGTSSIFSLVHALRHLRVPGKLAQVAFFSVRYVEVIQREYERLRDAMRIRCFQPQAALHTYRSYAYLVGMLLVRSYERSQRVYRAMLCRGYQGTFPVYHHFELTRADWTFGGAMFVAILALMII